MHYVFVHVCIVMTRFTFDREHGLTVPLHICTCDLIA